MIGVVVSHADPASTLIGERLLAHGTWRSFTDTDHPKHAGGGTVYRQDHFELRSWESIHLELTDIAPVFSDPSVLVFVSRHAGETGPLLSTHFPGNVGSAQFGGVPNEVPAAAPRTATFLYHGLKGHAPDGYDVGLECTHHGPSSVGASCVFVEVGSSATEWNDPAGTQAVANAVMALPAHDPSCDRTVVGFGGGHYVPRFERIIAETGWCVGHIAADWAIEEIGDPAVRASVIAQLFEQSGAEFALVDGDAPDLRDAINSAGYRVISETWLRETDGVDLHLVGAVEDRLGAIDEGVRLGAHTDVDPAALCEHTLPGQLINRLQAHDREIAVETIAGTVTAYASVENGKRLRGPVLCPPDITYRDIIERCVPILEDICDDVALTHEALVLTDESFDPQKARELGVDEGPAFGTLASGSPVDVGGRTVEPDEVMTRREQRIAIERS